MAETREDSMRIATVQWDMRRVEDFAEWCGRVDHFAAVAADDYGRDPVRGRVVALTAQRVVIRRRDPAVGEVNVHFPRSGFRLTPAQED